MQLNGTAGLRFDPVTFVVGERVSIVQYVRALGITDPQFTSVTTARDKGYTARPVVPALLGFLLTVTEDDLTARLGFTWGKTLNSEIGVEWSGKPVTEEDQLTGRSMVESCWERAGRDGRTRQFLRLRTDFTLGDAVVCRWRVLFMESKSTPPDDAVPREESSALSDDPVVVAADQVENGAVGESGGGELPGHQTPVIDRLTLARLSTAFDNPDPLHLDDFVAQAAGFEQVIGHGAAILGLLHEPVRRWAGLDAPTRMVTRQKAPFGLGATLIASGKQQSPKTGGVRDCVTAVRTGEGEIATAQIEVIPAVNSRQGAC